MTIITTGLELLHSSGLIKDKTERLGLLSNPASVDRLLIHAKELIDYRFPGQLKALFAPQHGFYAEKQDNMIESDHMTDTASGIPIFSLYHKERRPSKEMFEKIDTLIVDIQDVGTRVYTFIYTLSYCMEAAAEHGKRIIILDRPNPLGGHKTEGNILNYKFSSFVGRYPIPMRHGMTIGEIGLMFNEHFSIGCSLDIVKMNDWKRSMYYNDTGLPWVLPSPNLPTPDAAYVYPGQVIFEGTNISEGRGTAKPFELTGAPFINPNMVISSIDKTHLSGIHLRPCCFEPTSNKWSKNLCFGFQTHIKDIDNYKPYISSIALLQAIIKTSGDLFQWKSPPYEYEHEKLPIDLILGDKSLREQIEELEDLTSIEKEWQDKLEKFNAIKRKFHLYK